MKRKMADRYYLPVTTGGLTGFLNDIGTLLKVSGVVLEGVDGATILLLPSANASNCLEAEQHQLTLDEWAEVIEASDNPTFWAEDNGVGKILLRKARFEISGETQQKVWARDGFTCQFCGATMGNVLMTIDHWIPLARGGKNDASNYLTCCKRENKAKGDQMPEEFLKNKPALLAKLTAKMEALK
jgi:5-methylcytosine-specific restriction enzyme A